MKEEIENIISLVHFSLIQDYGLKKEKAQELSKKHEELIHRGEERGSLISYIAGEILEAEAQEMGLSNWNDIPRKWEGFDPSKRREEDEEQERDNSAEESVVERVKRLRRETK